MQSAWYQQTKFVENNPNEVIMKKGSGIAKAKARIYQNWQSL